MAHVGEAPKFLLEAQEGSAVETVELLECGRLLALPIERLEDVAEATFSEKAFDGEAIGPVDDRTPSG